MKISALVPFKSDNGGIRDRNLAYVRKRYETLMPEVELVIGEDQSELFNRSKAINRAAAKATGDLLMIVDGDIFFGTRLIDKIMVIAPDHPWIIPFCRGYKLTLEMSRKVTESETIKLPDRLRPGDIERNCFYYGAFINVMSRKAFETVGGMDERFHGWGGEEEALVRALDTLVGKHYRMDETIFHLWHPPADLQHPHHHQNDALKERYYRAFGDVNAM
ncbi:MAG TPA: galactosyltransferase-related protein, partial [Bacillota bacterium]|nr:galactosyltransferase-related protein [Bacillota bacterium]